MQLLNGTIHAKCNGRDISSLYACLPTLTVYMYIHIHMYIRIYNYIYIINNVHIITYTCAVIILIIYILNCIHTYVRRRTHSHTRVGQTELSVAQDQDSHRPTKTVGGA